MASTAVRVEEIVSALASSSFDGHCPLSLTVVSTGKPLSSRHFFSNRTPALCSCSPGFVAGPSGEEEDFLSRRIRTGSRKGKSRHEKGRGDQREEFHGQGWQSINLSQVKVGRRKRMHAVSTISPVRFP